MKNSGHYLLLQTTIPHFFHLILTLKSFFSWIGYAVHYHGDQQEGEACEYLDVFPWLVYFLCPLQH